MLYFLMLFILAPILYFMDRIGNAPIRNAIADAEREGTLQSLDRKLQIFEEMKAAKAHGEEFVLPADYRE